ncbi:helix-turn-helix transcriptional regulator [Rhizobium sp. KVB221]|uniref:Helix-turn-helix transcriptional regulator n=1 Tax=Rhizobium setariae TaxID=2801340 RepID=A0A936YUE5_9HYPH|nr:helix-turn-helix transcriptional regulator [Rhizobium setariae]MBL0375311.1 helix-turn-helix transcriptional regulator [Rhizobium setariae]
MIDSDWFYRQLEREGRSLRDMAKALGLDPSAVSRMLRGERKISAEEQDGIAKYFGVPLSEVAARRRGDVVSGFGERGREPFSAGSTTTSVASTGKSDVDLGNATAGNFYDRIRGCMKGTVTIPSGVDLTEPADPEWAKLYDDD